MSLYKIIAQDIDTLRNLVQYLEQSNDTTGVEVELALRKVTDIYNEISMLKKSNATTYIHLGENKPKADDITAKVVQKEVIEKVLPKEQIEEKSSETNEKVYLSEPEFDNNTKDGEIQKTIFEHKDIEENAFIAEKEPVPNVVELEATATDTISENENIEEVQLYAADDILIADNEEAELTKQAEIILQEQAEKKVSEIKKGEVVADRFVNNTSVNDLLSGFVNNKDLASAIKDKPIKNIQKSIKINDRIWYIKELFNGDAELYKEVVVEIETKKNLDSALAFIFDRFSWDQEKTSTISFLELVFRRFAEQQ